MIPFSSAWTWTVALCHGDDFCVLKDVEAIKYLEEVPFEKYVRQDLGNLLGLSRVLIGMRCFSTKR